MNIFKHLFIFRELNLFLTNKFLNNKRNLFLFDCYSEIKNKWFYNCTTN